MDNLASPHVGLPDLLDPALRQRQLGTPALADPGHRHGDEQGELRDAAVSYASHGWPIVPGGPDCLPVAQPCGSPPGLSAPQALETWTHAPYPILLACGRGIDAVDIPAAEGEHTLAALRESGAIGPVVVTSHGRWLLLVTSGLPLHPTLGVRVLGSGSWAVLPPTEQHDRPHRWRIPPEAAGWTLPCRNLVQDALFQALRTTKTTRPDQH
ncbi:bifunctional DNA primase/polymerase [Streptoalloteichus hindustanus]|uniref:Bifunctional DNA primase/polymerase, N-terminal n=1 Tax=Streptoalloteichus hindustanus TaxID=2017 RepID=A0A1M5DAF4_STRHI|nr:bifunctional DNA primase/polymerase [Streptoalloteichus hindustanus]SHF63937.1 Bifunctional DNA primase/polymerase, N-terminal [Streptoalloteichus hindustanus]